MTKTQRLYKFIILGGLFLLGWFPNPVIAGSKVQTLLTQQEEVAACLELREKAAACAPLFIEKWMDLRTERLAQPLTVEERLHGRSVGVKELIADGIGPMPERRKRCESAIERAKSEPNPALPQRQDVEALKDCYRQTSCPARVTCMIQVIDRFSFRQPNLPSRITVPPPSSSLTKYQKEKPLVKPKP